AVVEPAGDRVALRLPDKTITLPAVCAPAVHHLRSGTDADAGTLPGLDTADATVLIRRLLREGVVVPAAEPTLQP
ncbi:cupin, partial [Mycobacterium sp. ITM-2017-0098]